MVLALHDRSGPWPWPRGSWPWPCGSWPSLHHCQIFLSCGLLPQNRRNLPETFKVIQHTETDKLYNYFQEEAGTVVLYQRQLLNTPDVFHPPPLRLESCKPLWRDMQSIDVTSRWREDWQSATVVNSTLVVDPTIRLSSFDLHRCQWSLVNRFLTGQGHCNACHKKWGFTDNELCDCRLKKSRQCHTSSTLVH